MSFRRLIGLVLNAVVITTLTVTLVPPPPAAASTPARPVPATYLQGSQPWREQPYAGGTVRSFGCGPTAMANVLKGLGKDVNPSTAARWSTANGYASKTYANAKTKYAFFVNYGAKYGIKVTRTDSQAKAEKAVRDGNWVISQMIVPKGASYGRWTRHSHYITWYAISGSDAIIRDPAFTSPSKVRAPISALFAEAKTFFIVDVNATLKKVSGKTPTITGTPYVGKTLKSEAGKWGPGTVKLSYQWYRSGKKISGATKTSYKLTKTDLGATIKVKVTGKKTNYTKTTKTSAATKTVVLGKVSGSTPTITGQTTVGETLTVKAGQWGPGTVKLSYQWYRSGKKISGATKTSYILTEADVGTTITVKVTGTKTNYTKTTKTSAPTNDVAPEEKTAVPEETEVTELPETVEG